VAARRQKRVAVGLAVAGSAAAQDAPMIDIQRFDPEPQPDGFARILEPTLFESGTWSFALGANYGFRPFELRNKEGMRTIGIVDHLVGGDLTASYVLARGLQLGVQIPVLQYQAGPADPGLVEALGGSGNTLGMGDLAVTGSLAILNPEQHGVGVVLSPRAVFPTGASGQFVGIDTYGFGGRLAIGRAWEKFRLSFNATYQVNLSSLTIVNLHPDDEAGVGLGVAFDVGNDWEMGVEFTGATSVSPFLVEEVGVHAFNGPHTPMEIMLTIRPASYGLVKPIFGGGVGLNSGYGTPVARGYGLLRVSNAVTDVDTDADGLMDRDDQCPEEPEDHDVWEDEDGCPDPDNDGDRIPDTRDRCRMAAEDVDQFEDDDGCPEDDNDADGIFDSVDQCPMVAEVYNGTDDTDGCPEGDADGDGFYDVVDGCPDAAEDVDRYQDEDGCPDPDNDSDGFLDGSDGCPDEPEDFDAFTDEDGCPDPDNDGDGFLDGQDACPLEPETVNEHQDDDGCPDQLLARIVGTQIQILDRVYFDVNKTTIKEVSFPVLDAVFDVLETNPRMTLVEIQGHTDSDGADAANLTLSQGRAEAVRDYLIAKGIDGARLVARGYGEGVPLESNATAAGKATNRRVEFHIVGAEGE
jgi:OOP family OmpA-OmpF porin